MDRPNLQDKHLSMVFFLTRETCSELGIPFSGKEEAAYKISVSELLEKVRGACSKTILEPFKGCVVTIARFSHISEGGYQIIGFYDPKSESFT